MPETSFIRRLLFITLAIGLVIRLWFVLSGGLSELFRTGGDDLWYIQYGIGFFMPEPRGVVLGGNYAIYSLNVAPLYLVFVGFIEQFWQYPYMIG
ncbi:MAG: hypothetical protein WBC91_10570, partial [Phototrophicaceae bacterium]